MKPLLRVVVVTLAVVAAQVFTQGLVPAMGADPVPPPSQGQTTTGEALVTEPGTVDGKTLTRKKAVRITGKRRVGAVLRAKGGTWKPKPAKVAVRWLRNGTLISGAKGRRYRLTAADLGKRISVRVTAAKPGYERASTVSPQTVPIKEKAAVKVKRTFTYSITTRGAITANVGRFATLAQETFDDERGWAAAGFRFRRVARGGDFTLVLANASTLPSFGYPCSSQWSCRSGRYVIINQTRWQHASPAWNAAGLRLRDYRHMVVNHETGHWLGHRHLSCGGRGKLAPVMMQQSKGLSGCRFNPFPLPSERWTNR